MTFTTYTTHGPLEVIPATEYRALRAQLATAKRRYARLKNWAMAIIGASALAVLVACGRGV